MTPAASWTAPGVALVPTRAPDCVLVVGATGHVGRVFLEQGLAMYGATVPFRVLLRDEADADRFGAHVKVYGGDVTDIDSIRRACRGMSADSVIFDATTSIDLSATDARGAIEAVNLTGPRNLLTVARELGATLHKAHSMAGLPCPDHGPITEATRADPATESSIYATLPYVRCKRRVTQDLLEAQAEGAPVMFSYLVTPWGPWCRADALTNRVVAWSLALGRYVHPADVGIAYVDARDAAKAHWLAYDHGIADHVLLSADLSQEAFAGFLAEAAGKPVSTLPVSRGVMLTLGRAMDGVRRWLPGLDLPLSEAIVRLMFANNAFDASKARDLLGFQPRPAAQTFGDHFHDLGARGILRTRQTPRKVSVW